MKVFLMEGINFVKDLKKNDVCFVVILNKPSKRTKDNVPEEIDKLLTEYVEIISDNVPDGSTYSSSRYFRPVSPMEAR